MRRYIRIKTSMAFVVAVSCGLLYWWIDVDLSFLWSVATFVLCYIPHVGNTIAIILPLPLVFLDPDKTWGDLAIVFVVPFIIHQLVTNLIEPKLLAQSLDLHPIIVLLSLAFWSTIWGAVGAILSVPLTAVTRMMLLEAEHPYARPIVHFLKGDMRDPRTTGKNAVGPTRSVEAEAPRRSLEDKSPQPKQGSGGESPDPWTSSPQTYGYRHAPNDAAAFEGDGGLPTIRRSQGDVPIVGRSPSQAIGDTPVHSL
jgi:hypothetical protein